jgi:[NiFe] hydrogenase assembly HybE family chaperone
MPAARLPDPAAGDDPPAVGVGGGLAARVQALEALFREVAEQRMQGVPMLHEGLAVCAVGFEAEPGGAGALGVLVTPWFMNLVWLPLQPNAPALAVGASRQRAVGGQGFDFLGAFEPGFGAYEACSLFSPMFEFADQAAALATAVQVLQLLRQPAPVPQPVAPPGGPAPSRRALLFGRGAAA